MNALRTEMVQLVTDRLTPIGLDVGYCDAPLEEKIKWLPCVLILGNYSSGKSTMINELLGRDVQLTGQAPTDDSFTVLAYDEHCSEIEERDGKALLGSTQYPFGGLKKFGQRLSSHLRLKKLDSPILKNLSLIDTPGMLDSVAERDRGYDYQQVIGELAGIADLIIIMFDPHKAGTIRETYESLRRTLPKATYEDRVLFVLSRVDECSHLPDFLRVYGTLCWNLSQMTGRKDIPQIKLTWTQESGEQDSKEFLRLLDNQRHEIFQEIEKAPQHRLDHLATYIEVHCHAILMMLEAVMQYHRERSRSIWRSLGNSVFLGALAAGVPILGAGAFGIQIEFQTGVVAGVILGLASMVLAFWGWKAALLGRVKSLYCDHPEKLAKVQNDADRDTWALVEGHLGSIIKNESVPKMARVKSAHKELSKMKLVKLPEFRQALDEMNTLPSPSATDL